MWKLQNYSISNLIFIIFKAGNKENVSVSNMSVNGGGAGGSNIINHRGSKSRGSIMSNPKYDLDCWGDADKPFANITTENNATAQSIAITVCVKCNR